MPVELVEVDKELVTLEDDVELNPTDVTEGMVEDVDEGVVEDIVVDDTVVEDIVVDDTAVEDAVVVEDVVVATPEQPILGSSSFPVVIVVSSVVSVSPKKKEKPFKRKMGRFTESVASVIGRNLPMNT